MNPSRIFIQRPVATTLLMVALFLVGVLSYRLLPISALPQVDFPTMQVTTLYPGAGADVMAATVTAPLEKQLGQMPGLAQMYSVSSGEASVITLRFNLGMNLDIAAQQVQAAIDAAGAFLPTALPTPPIYNKVNPADAPILTLALTSKSIPLTQVQDIADSRLIPKLSQLNGVGLVTLTGGMRPAIRVQLDAQALRARGLSSTTVRNAISAANISQPKGDLSSFTRTSTLNANDQLVSAEDYQNLVIAWQNGAAVRLKDVAKVANSAENRRLAAWTNETSALIINIQRQPTANVIQVADQIKTLLPQLTADLPSDLHVTPLTDRTTTIRASVHDVQKELLTAILLVIAVIFVFLWDARATLIPAVAVPLSLIGTLTFIDFAGFSLNNLTLMALTIATGFVVDDAIVVVENIARYLEEGDSPLEAALKGSQQIGFTIISLTISLVAVLIPLLFMGDVVGRLFREFAITLTIAILLSAVISLTLTPMMCANMLKEHQSEPQQGLGAIIHRFLDRVIEQYGKSLQVVLRHEKLTLLIFLATLLSTAWLYQTAPKGFFPSQDTGIIQAITQARPDISFDAMAKQQQQVAKKILADPDVASLSSFLGVDGQNPTLNTGRMLINLKPFEQRSHSSAEISRRLQDTINPSSETRLFLQPVQDLSIDDRVTRTQYQFTVDATDYQQLAKFVPKILEKLQQNSHLVDVASDFQNHGLSAQIEVDRAAAGRLGIQMSTITDALYDAFGQRQISTIFTQGGQYRVILENDPKYQKNPRSLEQLFIPTASGQSIPITSIAKISEQSTFLSYTRQDQLPVATFSFNLPNGVSLESAVASVKNQLQELQLPATMSFQFQGTSIAFQAALQNQLWLILAAVVVMYLILGILYESFIHPITILSTLPSATLGALLAIHLTHAELGVMAIIGIILLIGIVKKNAIMMIDFALDAQRHRGLPPREAIYQACLLRFRPILMTTLAALLGALPLMFGTGVGHELRQPLGITLVGGLLVSQILTLFTTPVIYLLFDRWAQAISREKSLTPASHA